MQRKDAGLMMVPFASDGTYVYAGNATQYGSVYGNLTVINAKKKTKVTVGCDVSKVQKVKKQKYWFQQRMHHTEQHYI